MGSPTRSDLEIIFGKSNILQWADADNVYDTGVGADNDNANAAITARINWAIDQAFLYVVGRLAKRFDVAKWDCCDLPALVKNLVTMRAGIELYQAPRGLIDGDPANAQINSINLKVESQIEQILAGQLYLIDAVNPSNAPTVDGQTATNRDTLRLPWNDIHALDAPLLIAEPRDMYCEVL